MPSEKKIGTVKRENALMSQTRKRQHFTVVLCFLNVIVKFNNNTRVNESQEFNYRLKAMPELFVWARSFGPFTWQPRRK